MHFILVVKRGVRERGKAGHQLSICARVVVLPLRVDTLVPVVIRQIPSVFVSLRS